MSSEALGRKRGERAVDQVGAQAIAVAAAAPARGAADSIAAYSSAGLRRRPAIACAPASACRPARARSRRRTPRGCARCASSRLGVHAQRHAVAVVVQRRIRGHAAGAGHRHRNRRVRELRSARAAPGLRPRAPRTPRPRVRRSARAGRRGRAIRPARALCPSRVEQAQVRCAGAAPARLRRNRSPATATPVSLRRKRASSPSMRIARPAARCASANARAKSGAGTKLRRSVFGSDLISAAALSATKPGASHDSRAGSSALSRCSGTTTVMPSSGAPGSKR